MNLDCLATLQANRERPFPIELPAFVWIARFIQVEEFPRLRFAELLDSAIRGVFAKTPRKRRAADRIRLELQA